jgi:RHS repeat-associated protein
VIVLASCGKNDPMLRDISMPIDDFPPSAELYLHDVQGTPVARVDALGSVVAEAATHPYGAVRYESGSVEPYGFVGNERDFGAGVSDFQARPYRPELSRFLAVDPVPLFIPLAGVHLRCGRSSEWGGCGWAVCARASRFGQPGLHLGWQRLRRRLRQHRRRCPNNGGVRRLC